MCLCDKLWHLGMQEGEPSHKLYVKEREDLLASLQRRATQLYKVLNQLEGITCNEPQGALYCMPRIRLSKKVLEVRAPNCYNAESAYQTTFIALQLAALEGNIAGGLGILFFTHNRSVHRTCLQASCTVAP